jgi:hypothetical protein
VSTPPIPASRDDFARWCESAGIHTVVAGASDTHGIWRGKRLPVAADAELLQALRALLLGGDERQLEL